MDILCNKYNDVENLLSQITGKLAILSEKNHIKEQVQKGPPLVFSVRMIKLRKISGKRSQTGAAFIRKGATLMAMHVCWVDNLAKAQETARKTNKPILLDFFNPQ